MLLAISPIDGRYREKVKELESIFSEYALIKYRAWVEIKYLLALKAFELPELEGLSSEVIENLLEDCVNLSPDDALAIKATEAITNHDVKAVEYHLKEKLREYGGGQFEEFIHFGLTSQDINNTAIPLMIKQCMEEVYLPNLCQVIDELEHLANEWIAVPMLARTHGQPASPTTVGKELLVFVVRIKNQLTQLKNIPFSAKFGGATGNMNAHYLTYPDRDWHGFAEQFVTDIGLSRSYPTTQIEHYDNLAALFDACARINNILIDFCKDIWAYISMDYFKQKVVKNEVGSSAMPHKVNPIDFENAEGNLAMANAVFSFLSHKLPISRLQRDLTDSTVLRNVGVPFAHTLIAFKSTKTGLKKLQINHNAIQKDLDGNWAIVAEGIQSILRKEGYPQPYEALKKFTRGNQEIDKVVMHQFVDSLSIDENLKLRLKEISPSNYLGRV